MVPLSALSKLDQHPSAYTSADTGTHRETDATVPQVVQVDSTPPSELDSPRIGANTTQAQPQAESRDEAQLKTEPSGVYHLTHRWYTLVGQSHGSDGEVIDEDVGEVLLGLAIVTRTAPDAEPVVIVQ